MKLKWMGILFIAMASFLSVGGVFAQDGGATSTTVFTGVADAQSSTLIYLDDSGAYQY